MKDKCNNCKKFFECDNTGTYDKCISENYSEFEIDLFNCEDLEYVCQVALCSELTKEDVEALLARNDIDTDYNDIYFHPMIPICSIRDSLKENKSALKYL